MIELWGKEYSVDKFWWTGGSRNTWRKRFSLREGRIICYRRSWRQRPADVTSQWLTHQYGNWHVWRWAEAVWFYKYLLSFQWYLKIERPKALVALSVYSTEGLPKERIQNADAEGWDGNSQKSAFLTSSLGGPQPTFLRNTVPEGTAMLLCYLSLIFWCRFPKSVFSALTAR